MARPRLKAKKGDTVRVHYTCKLANGTVIDSSEGSDPLEFTIGKGEIIKGLEEAVSGMKIGQSKTITVAPEKAYGPHHGEWVLDVNRDKLPGNQDLDVGLRIDIPREGGQSSTATVMHVSALSVTLDFNHPLAGKELIFEVRLLEIK